MANFNNYPYNYYPYGSYQPYMQPNQQMQQNNNMNQQNMNNMMYQQPQAQQSTTYLPLTYVSGIVGAKAFIVAPNQTVYLRDSEEGSNLLFQKSADAYGKYTIKAYSLTEINLDDTGKPVQVKENTPNYATKQDLNDLQAIFEERMNNLSLSIQNAQKTAKNNEYTKGGK